MKRSNLIIYVPTELLEIVAVVPLGLLRTGWALRDEDDM